jgi:hypothetical protein
LSGDLRYVIFQSFFFKRLSTPQLTLSRAFSWNGSQIYFSVTLLKIIIFFNVYKNVTVTVNIFEINFKGIGKYFFGDKGKQFFFLVETIKTIKNLIKSLMLLNKYLYNFINLEIFIK